MVESNMLPAEFGRVGRDLVEMAGIGPTPRRAPPGPPPDSVSWVVKIA